MKKFEIPEIEVVTFNVEDIIAVSIDEGAGGDNDLGIG